MARPVLRVGVLELRRRPGTQRDIHVATPLADLGISSARVPDEEDVVVDGVMEAVEGGVTISGTVTAPWTGECRRCLEPVSGELSAVLSEVFEPNPTDGETYALEGDEVDLEPPVRDAVLLHLPLAPLCRLDCPGPAPEEYPTSAAVGDDAPDEAPDRDPRWAALDELRLEP